MWRVENQGKPVAVKNSAPKKGHRARELIFIVYGLYSTV